MRAMIMCVWWQCLQSNVIYNHFHLILLVCRCCCWYFLVFDFAGWAGSCQLYYCNVFCRCLTLASFLFMFGFCPNGYANYNLGILQHNWLWFVCGRLNNDSSLFRSDILFSIIGYCCNSMFSRNFLLHNSFYWFAHNNVAIRFMTNNFIL